SILIPITEVGSLASAVGWLAASAAYARLGPGGRERAMAAMGISVASLLVLMKFLPFVPGHFSAYEYLALGLWILAGLLLWQREKPLARAI
ncbi:MAG TPA: hypothetical protein VHM88_26000, partial [Candidatus Acidoferrales bacterium]|nr:hypothetical protein [Candidatus Acidoferrales bacterium]